MDALLCCGGGGGHDAAAAAADAAADDDDDDVQIWDDEMALVASKWARQCVTGHDSGSRRQVPCEYFTEQDSLAIRPFTGWGESGVH